MSKIRHKLAFLHDRIPERPPGYFEDFMAVGRIDGEWIEFDEEDWKRLLQKYRNAGKTGLRGCCGD